MTRRTSRFQQIDALFRAALRLEAHEREAFLEGRCAGDESLRRDASALLAEDRGGAGVLDREWPAAWFGFDAPGSRPEEHVPQAIPGYRVIRRVGVGGMGVVYEAEQEHPRRTVALKVMRTATASADAVRRFELEVQVLGRLQHPGIAQIFGAGTFETDAGRQPFLAMEFVQGEPLTRYADDRSLTTRERLELVASTCDAVQHAHQRGVIHRDLKPGNILVVGEENQPSTTSQPGAADESTSAMRRRAGRTLGATGRPKILDFGVARAIDLDTDRSLRHTTAGQIVGTVPYMSPEQAASDELDTRSDVYALGVVAFELLTGRLPYDVRDKPPFEAARVIREEEPMALSTIDRRLAGDVETIVGKALEKDRARRYQSASEFAADIRRHLRDEPIAARPHSAWYHIRKLARRHRVAVWSMALACLAVVVGVTAVSVALFSAIRDRGEAARQAAIAQTVNDFLNDDLLGATDPDDGGGRDVTVREVLDRAAATLGGTRFSETPSVEAAVRATIGRAYRRLGELSAAEPHLERSLALHESMLGPDHRDTITSMNELSKLRTLQGRVSDAERLDRAVLAAKRRTLGNGHQSTIVSLNNLASLVRHERRLDEALALHEEAYALANANLPSDNPYRVKAVGGLASMYRDLDRLDEAERLFVEALALSRQLHGDEHTSTLRTMNSLAILYQKQRRYPEAEALLQEAIALQSSRVGRRHSNVLAYLNNLGVLYEEMGRLAEASDVLDEALASSREVLGVDHRGTLYTMSALARVKRALDERAAAERLMLEAVAGWTALTGAASDETRRAEALLGEAYSEWGRNR